MASPAFLTAEGTTDPADVLITVRFSASIPDLPLDVSEPQKATGAGLKQLIRTNLPKELSSHRLRLIYAGRGLEDSIALSISLKLPPSPTRTPRPAEDSEEDSRSETGNGKNKGKQPIRDNRPRIYIHCSIGDIALSEVDLAAEASIASTDLLQRQKDEERLDSKNGSSLFTSKTSTSQSEAPPPPTTTPAPRGFDRLLSAGFTPSEVTALRSQFLAVQSVSRTPDTMPSGEELRDLEDRWMDEGSTGVNVGADGGGGGGGIGEDDGGFGSGSRSAMDDMLWGAVMGFFWPIGCAMWLRREEGVWSWRKGVAVFVGVLVNAAFGTMRIMN